MQENKNVNAPVEASEEEQLIEQARIRREKLAKLVSEGKNPYEMVKYPVDADSEMIKNNLVDFVASDMHKGREYHMAKAYAYVEKKFGKSKADQLFKENAEKLLKG